MMMLLLMLLFTGMYEQAYGSYYTGTKIYWVLRNFKACFPSSVNEIM
jgi:hypothetical protein